MSGWKELQVNNLPTDILTGDYEFEYHNDFEWKKSSYKRINMLDRLLQGQIDYRYRKPEPKQPTYEEIIKFHISNIKGCIPSQLGNAVLFLLESAGIPQEEELNG